MSGFNRNDKAKDRNQKVSIFQDSSRIKTSIQIGANIIIESSAEKVNPVQDKVAATHFKPANKPLLSATPNPGSSMRAKTPLQMNHVPLPAVKGNPNQNANIAALFPDSMRSNVRPSLVSNGPSGGLKQKSQFQYNAKQAKTLIPVTSPMPPEVPPATAEMPNVEVPDAIDVQMEDPIPLNVEEDYNLSQIIHQHFETKKIQEAPKSANEEPKPAEEEPKPTNEDTKNAVQPNALFKEKVKKPAEEKSAHEALVNSNVSIPPSAPAIIAPEKPESMHIDGQISIEKVSAGRYILYLDSEDVEVVIKRRKI